jgi:hypothetical protein
MEFDGAQVICIIYCNHNSIQEYKDLRQRSPGPDRFGRLALSFVAEVAIVDDLKFVGVLEEEVLSVNE